MRQNRHIQLAAVVAALALSLTACGSKAETDQTPAVDTPVTGGVLKIAGSGDVDYLDPAASYYQVTYGLLRGLTRQIIAYPDSADHETAITPVADLAAEMPSVSEDGLTYTIKLRTDATWDIASGPRAIVAGDVVRGIKRVCNPVAPFGGATYYTDTIVGMAKFCEGFAKVGTTADAIKAYVEGTTVEGLTALDDTTVTIKLNKPRGDFMNILALVSSSPAPVEFLDYVPDSPEFRQHFISSGPYRIAEYVAEQKYHLVRNTNWSAASDPIRKAYVDEVIVTLGSDEDPVFKEIQAGTVDMTWDTGIPAAELPMLLQTKDKRLSLNDDGSIAYMAINLQSPNANGALKNLKVRQALNYAVSKKNIIQIVGGPDLKQPNDQVLTPPLNGYSKIEPYPTTDHNGDVEKAKALLAEAGFPNGITLTYLYRDAGKGPEIAQTLQADLAKAGITLKLKPTTANNFYTSFLMNIKATKKGEWDIAAPGWGPDWQGNAAVTFFAPLIDGRAHKGCTIPTTNYGCYNNDAVNALIDKAVASSDATESARYWAEADALVMADAPWVPLYTGKFGSFRSDRVQNWNYGTLSGNGDITNVWLKA